MKIYKGFRRHGTDAVVIVENGEFTKQLDPCYDLRNHSPDGFEWGYAGSGPAQLALALLVDAVGDKKALKYYQQFKSHVIQNLERGSPWSMSADDIAEVVKTLERVA